MVTVLVLQHEGVTEDIGILDIDEHYGNGTEDIREKRGVSGLRHYTFGGEGIEPDGGDAWLERLPSIVRSFQGCGLVLYQAGADPHVHDPHSRKILNDEQLLRRDRIVFRELHKLGVPVVWNLAGGYQTPLRKVLDIHDNTMRACVETYLGDVDKNPGAGPGAEGSSSHGDEPRPADPPSAGRPPRAGAGWPSEGSGAGP
jgi:acetoin utilization deacetylase AcuC-like enzyme